MRGVHRGPPSGSTRSECWKMLQALKARAPTKYWISGRAKVRHPARPCGRSRRFTLEGGSLRLALRSRAEQLAVLPVEAPTGPTSAVMIRVRVDQGRSSRSAMELISRTPYCVVRTAEGAYEPSAHLARL